MVERERENGLLQVVSGPNCVLWTPIHIKQINNVKYKCNIYTPVFQVNCSKAVINLYPFILGNESIVLLNICTSIIL